MSRNSKPGPDDDTVMTAREVWQMLRIGKNTLYELVRQNKIPYKHIGHQLRFSRRRIDEWMDDQDNANEGGDT